MASTYLELVNKAIVESGVDLDQLTAGTFASPPDPYHVKFKNWVNDAWKEIQLERPWMFTQTMHLQTNPFGDTAGQGLNSSNTSDSTGLSVSFSGTDYTFPVLIIPRGAFLTTNFVAGNWVKGYYSQATARLVCDLVQDNNLSGEYPQGTNPEQGFRYKLYVAGGSGAFEFGEPLEVYSNSGGTLGVLLSGIGNGVTVVDINPYRITSYNGINVAAGTSAGFTELSHVNDGIEIDKNTFRIAQRPSVFTFGAAEQPSLVTTSVLTDTREKSQLLRWLDWDDFYKLAYLPDGTMMGKETALGIPRYVTQDPMGYYRFYPTFDYRSNEIWDVYCDIKVQQVDMPVLNAAFIPKILPRQYRDMIAWRAVMYYANDDSKPDKWRTANGRYMFYKRRLEEEMMEQPKWESNPYKRGLGHSKR